MMVMIAAGCRCGKTGFVRDRRIGDLHADLAGRRMAVAGRLDVCGKSGERRKQGKPRTAVNKATRWSAGSAGLSLRISNFRSLERPRCWPLFIAARPTDFLLRETKHNL